MRFSRGFSLIELMTVIALIGIITGATFVSLSGKRSDEELKTMAREVAAAIRMAQINALGGNREGVPSNNQGLCWVEVSKVSSATYQAFTRSVSNSGDNCATDGSIGTPKSFSLSDGVTFSTTNWNSGGNSIKFEIPRASILPAGTVSRIVLVKDGRYSAVCVLASGVIVEKPVGSALPSCL